ncbi:MAG: O-antigen ligase family protein [Fimbriimonadaceae bacterium]
MKKPDPGMFCLCGAVAFAVIAGGHVSLDTQPGVTSPLGLILTLIAVFACLSGAFVLWNDDAKSKLVGIALVVIGAGVVLVDLVTGGDNFATVRMFTALLVFGGLTYVLATRRVVQLPTAVYGGFAVLLVASLGISILVSEFRVVSLDAWLYWLCYAAAMYLAVSVLGRVKGPAQLADVVIGATSFVAIKGIVEYLAARADEPTYRIFADWNNPNALAGLLGTALPLALCVVVSSSGARRSFALAAGAAVTAALVLTQSKGGLIAAAVGIVAFLVCALVWKAGKKALFALASIAAGAVVFGLIVFTTPSKAEGAPAARLVAGTEQAQSTEYRKLLWKGAIELAKRQPVGYGVGTYRFNSARSGLNEQTQLTHQTYLQVLVEGGWLALIGIVGLAVVWTLRMFRGASALSQERNLLRAGVFAAVVACAANGFLESNLYYFGSGLLLFVLIGAGLQLAADGTSPESLPSGLRGMIVATCCALPILAMLWMYWLDGAKTTALAAVERRDVDSLESSLSTLASLGALDGDSWYLRAVYGAKDEGERTSALEKAAALAPSTRHLRALAQMQAAKGDAAQALRTLDRALFYDPNNMRTLALKMNVESGDGDTASAKSTAERIIAVESTPYLQVRALPDVVPTEPFTARIFLASVTTDKAEKVKLLRAAVEGLVRYAQTMVPKIKQFAEAGLAFGGESVQDAEETLATARQSADELIALYGESGDETGAEEVRELSRALTLD